MLDFLNPQGAYDDPRLQSPARIRYADLSDEEFLKNYHKLLLQPRKPVGQSPTNALTDAIIKYINSHYKCKVYRINSMGLYDERINPRTGRPIGMRSSGQKKGLPDVIGAVYGMFASVEVKVGKDRQSEHQIKRQEEIQAAGGWYCIAKDFDSFKKEFDSLYVIVSKNKPHPQTLAP